MKPGINKRGYITLEAAIFLPVLILAVASIAFYITLFSTIENVTYCNIEETARLASKASFVKVAPGFTGELESRIYDENPAINDLKTERFNYLYWDGDLDNMIAVNENYNVNLNLPMGFDHEIGLSSRVKCRGFTGLRSKGEPMSFEEMESEGNWDPVWIFPDSGEKFHGPSCTYVKANACEMVLTTSLKRRFEPCSLCEASNISVGTLVYCFKENGTAYHRSSCRQVDRYAIEINKDEALDKGYVPCSKCKGG